MRFRLLVIPALLLLLAGSVGCGGYQTIEYEQWEIYPVKRSTLPVERAKLAKVVQEVLLHRHYFWPANAVKDLASAGKDGDMEPHWNDEDARMTSSSMQGYRYKVGVKIKEGIDHIPQRKGEDAIEERYLSLAVDTDPATAYLTICVGAIGEVNKRMNMRRGDYEQAEWEGTGQAKDIVARLRTEIRERYSQVAERAPSDGREGSSRTERIMERGTDAPKEQDPHGKVWGPGNEKNQNGNQLDFGTGSGRN